MLKKELEKLNKDLNEQKRVLKGKNINLEISNSMLMYCLRNIRNSLINVGFSIKKEYKDGNQPYTDEDFDLDVPQLYLRFNDKQIDQKSPLFEFIMEFDRMIKHNGGKND